MMMRQLNWRALLGISAMLAIVPACQRGHALLTKGAYAEVTSASTLQAPTDPFNAPAHMPQTDQQAPIQMARGRYVHLVCGTQVCNIVGMLVDQLGAPYPNFPIRIVPDATPTCMSLAGFDGELVEIELIKDYTACPEPDNSPGWRVRKVTRTQSNTYYAWLPYAARAHNLRPPSGGTCTDNSGCSSNEYCSKPFGSCDARFGVCKARPNVCEQVWDPVCTCEGVTASNAACAAVDGLNVQHDGPCALERIDFSGRFMLDSSAPAGHGWFENECGERIAVVDWGADVDARSGHGLWLHSEFDMSLIIVGGQRLFYLRWTGASIFTSEAPPCVATATPTRQTTATPGPSPTPGLAGHDIIRTGRLGYDPNYACDPWMLWCDGDIVFQGQVSPMIIEEATRLLAMGNPYVTVHARQYICPGSGRVTHWIGAMYLATVDCDGNPISPTPPTSAPTASSTPSTTSTPTGQPTPRGCPPTPPIPPTPPGGLPTMPPMPTMPCPAQPTPTPAPPLGPMAG